MNSKYQGRAGFSIEEGSVDQILGGPAIVAPEGEEGGGRGKSVTFPNLQEG